ncbi:MAG: efflux RND transporter periplasmic adaptor subunit [Planctomycetota bacterium]|jgi:multidrug efflux pump subunit AcrA (membrane-fusion protein)
MSTEALAKTPPGRWRKLALLAIGLVVGGASAVAFIPQAGSSGQIAPESTHTITRGELIVTVTEQGTLESADNTEIKCRVRGHNTIIWVVEAGTEVEPGDELVRLDTLAIEDAIAERTKYSHWSRSSAERSKADVRRSELAISEYLEGRYPSQLMRLKKDLAIAQSNLTTSQSMLAHAEMMAERGYVSELEVDEDTFAVTRATLNVDVKKTEIDVLKEFTKAIELETLEGNLNAARARHAANEERAQMDEARRVLAVEELTHCVIKAERSGLVIYPSPEKWKKAPKIEEQTLLLMPDLSRMQVKVGIHESIVDRVKPGLAARVTLPDRTLDGEVSSVSAVARPAGWWTGNVVKYDTIIRLPSVEGLKPGMSAEVEVIMARHEDVLTIPAAAVLQTKQGNFCWVRTTEAVERRSLQLGDTDDRFIVVETGVDEGDEVVLDPLASIDEAQMLVLQGLDKANSDEPVELEADHVN